AAQFQMPYSLRRLFAIILVFGEPGDVRTLWNDNFISMSEDFVRNGVSSSQCLINAVLLHIKSILEQHHRKLDEFDLPTLDLSEEQNTEELPRMEIHQLHVNMRTQNNHNYDFSNYLLSIGNGTEPTYNDEMIRISNHIVIPWKNEKSLRALIKYIYPNLTEHHLDISYFTEHAILAAKNEYIDHINDMILDQTPGDIITYKSYDSVPDDT
ncbi:1668_t:CDS:2, partial [Cetraspora pellucida]